MDGEDDSGKRSPEIRASDAERSQVVQRLNDAVGEGRLTLDEFAQRLDDTCAAMTLGELEALTADLPAAEPCVGESKEKRRWRVAIMGGTDYKGRWRVPPKTGFFALMGGSTIDLREATLEAQEIEITLVSIMGGSDVIVPRGVRVVVDAKDFLGGNDIKVDEDTVVTNAPVVRLRTYTVMGGNDVRHPKERRRKRER